jgi:thiol-disulfide isomerase/thioredoxin
MKKLILFVTFLLSATCTITAQGVAFLENGNLRTVFDQAKAQNKIVMIEVYSPECHVCQSFKPTFAHKNVGNFYNPRFVNYQLDIASEEAKGFLSKQKIWISSIPTLLFYDKNVDLQHIAVMSETNNSPQVLIDAATTALDPNKRVSNYTKMYNSGNRSPNFLMEYGFMSRIQQDTTACINAGQAYFLSQKPANYTSKTNLLVLEKMIIDTENGLFKYMIANLPKYYAVKKKEEVNTIAENIIMWTLYSGRGQNYNSQKIRELKGYLAKVGVDQKSINARAWMLEAGALFREKQNKTALNLIEERLKGMKLSASESTYLCKFIKSKTADKATLAYSKKWCK